MAGLLYSHNFLQSYLNIWNANDLMKKSDEEKNGAKTFSYFYNLSDPIAFDLHFSPQTLLKFAFFPFAKCASQTIFFSRLLFRFQIWVINKATRNA